MNFKWEAKNNAKKKLCYILLQVLVIQIVLNGMQYQVSSLFGQGAVA